MVEYDTSSTAASSHSLDLGLVELDARSGSFLGGGDQRENLYAGASKVLRGRSFGWMWQYILGRQNALEGGTPLGKRNLLHRGNPRSFLVLIAPCLLLTPTDGFQRMKHASPTSLSISWILFSPHYRPPSSTVSSLAQPATTHKYHQRPQKGPQGGFIGLVSDAALLFTAS